MWLITKDTNQDYRTHYVYIKCLSRLIDGCFLIYNSRVNDKKLPFLKKKGNLIKLTKKSLEDEYKIVCADNEYSYACISWLPVKIYYLLFNQFLTLEYIIKGKEDVFNTKHIDCLKNFTNKLEKKEIEFSNPILNQVFDKSILDWKSGIPGANLSSNTEKKILYRLIMKITANYKLNDWKRVNSIKDFRSKVNKEKKRKFLDGFKVSIFDFFYCMRIRANYRDFNFINNISFDETFKYFKEYYNFSLNFFELFKKLGEDLIKNKS